MQSPQVNFESLYLFLLFVCLFLRKGNVAPTLVKFQTSLTSVSPHATAVVTLGTITKEINVSDFCDEDPETLGPRDPQAWTQQWAPRDSQPWTQQ